MLQVDDKLEVLIQELPDENGVRAFVARLKQEHPTAFRKLTKERGLLSDLLALAAWSPLLAMTVEQNPEYISWLNRERGDTRVRTPEELKESLARFALIHSAVNPQVLLARFRRRELLRIYLHDVRRSHTLVETMEELSNLADAILDYALSLARQDLDNKYGVPQARDERGRITTAEFCVVALGKLGSHELNYASDIDLLFLYSEEGTTSGTGARGAVTNREYFVKLAESVTRLVGQQTGEGAAYRVDLRLRPFGRDGALASSLYEATRYYRTTAQQWELQALIRARAACGSAKLFARFAAATRRKVFRADISVKQALANVRLAKQKIDHHIERSAKGFNVKLGRGGIREIEFIAQALQLAHGGSDRWLRSSHTLIVLGRLADRRLLSEQERAALSDAYMFLRTLEHRVQMEHGLQTHTVPRDALSRTLVAKRMGFVGPGASAEFDRSLTFHTDQVQTAFERVFAEAPTEAKLPPRTSGARLADLLGEESLAFKRGSPVDADTAAAHAAAVVFAALPGETRDKATGRTHVAHLLQDAAKESVNAHRALMLTARVAASLDKATESVEIDDENLRSLVQLAGASEFFGELLAANPTLISSLRISDAPVRRDYRAILRAGIDPEKSFAGELSALRRAWSGLLMEIVLRDVAGELPITESNRLQTELAVATINVGYLIARREMVRRAGNLQAGPRICVLGLGRLGSGGLDYGSDLDVIMIYDSLTPSPIKSLGADETYARLGELMTSALSSVTREGHLYRIDLRLRPDGGKGPLVNASDGFIDYVKQRSAPWEWLAYVKLRAVAGDLELGRMIETHARHAVHELASQADPRELMRETRRVRDRLEKEKVKHSRHGALDIKYGVGGMLDVYFGTRFLQLRKDVRDEGEDRSTANTLRRLRGAGALSSDDYHDLSQGYDLLRHVDHQLRLLNGHSGSLPATDHPVTRDVAKQLGYSSAEQLIENLRDRMKGIRRAYDSITDSKG